MSGNWWDSAKSIADGISGGIDGYLNGTDGGGKAAAPVKNETVLLDQSQQDQRKGLPAASGMSTKTMMMIGGGLVLVLALVMVKK